MSIIEAILLGILQGATEFLPVSSSGHLVLFPAIFGVTQPSLSLIAIAHEGTLLAVLIYFRHDLWEIIKAVLNGLRERAPLRETNSRLGWYIAVGSIPAAAAGLLFEKNFEEVFGNPTAAAFFLAGDSGSTGCGGTAADGEEDTGGDDVAGCHLDRGVPNDGSLARNFAQREHDYGRNLARIKPGYGGAL